jgi:ATP-dependent Clp protease, protease subunit
MERGIQTMRHRKGIAKDETDSYFQYGVDRKNRRVFMFADIDNISIGTVIKALYYMDSESGGTPIELFVGSFGGSEYDAFALYDVMRSLKSPIHTTAVGCCMSAAPLLVAAGEAGHRYATPNTWFMVHQSWTDFDARRIDEIRKHVDHYEKMGDSWYELMAKHTKKDARFWRTQCEKVGDAYFDAEKAAEWGLIDHIWDEKEGEDA